MTLHRSGAGLSGAAAALLLITGLLLPRSPVQAAGAVATPATTQPRQGPQVHLMVPVETGQELGLLLPTAPSAQLVQIEGRNSVLLGRFADASVAYRLGRTFQARLRLPFELVYEAGHPQSDGRWLAQVRAEPLDRGVARLPVQGSRAQGRPTALALQPGLNYLVVKLQSSEQLQVLRRHAPLAELGARNGQMLARVGVYRPSRAGRRLLAQQMASLAALGFAPEVIAVSA